MLRVMDKLLRLAHDRRESAMDHKLKLSTPWVTLYNRYVAMFGDDPDVEVAYAAGDGEDPRIVLRVDNQAKADAIEQIVPKSYNFGGVVVTVTVVPANKPETMDALFRRAFEGNPAFSYSVTADGIFSNPITYVVFKNKVVQFWNDDLSDVNGNETTLYEDIAAEIFDIDGVSFCTDTPENLGAPIKKQ